MDKTPLKNYLYAAGATDIAAAVLILLLQARLPPEVPLFYGLPQGEEQLTKPIFLLIPVALSFAIILANLFLTRLVKDDFLKKVLAGASLATAIFAAITSFKIVFLVGNV